MPLTFAELREWNVRRCEAGDPPFKNWIMSEWIREWQGQAQKLGQLLLADAYATSEEGRVVLVAEAARTVALLDAIIARRGDDLEAAIRDQIKP